MLSRLRPTGLALLVLLTAVLPTLAACSSASPDEPGLETPSAIRTAGSLPRVVADCEHFALRPREIGVACGDGNYSLADAAYDSWTTAGAAGSALAVRNTCEPSCAEGSFTTSAVDFRLDRLIHVFGVPVFSRLTVLDPRSGQTLLVAPLLPMGCAVEPPSCPPSPSP